MIEADGHLALGELEVKFATELLDWLCRKRVIGSITQRNALTADQVVAIRGDTRFHREIAASFGVSRSLVGWIKGRKGWKHLPPEAR